MPQEKSDSPTRKCQVASKIKSYTSYLENEWLLGLMMLFGCPLLPVIFVVDVCKKIVRKTCTRRLFAEEQGDGNTKGHSACTCILNTCTTRHFQKFASKTFTSLVEKKLLCVGPLPAALHSVLRLTVPAHQS